ncbi:MAG: SIS domain-containing protein [bacterium]|nr:SIS domain-containing protein [bacterium]
MKNSSNIKEFAENYYSDVVNFIKKISVTDKAGEELEFYQAIEDVANMAMSCSDAGNKTIFIGNGASQAISSHMSTDIWKNGGVRGIAFTDPSVLTCIGNDYGYDFVFEKPIEMFADPGDILFATSSSGQSKNILNGCSAARKKDCSIVTLSGFKSDNPLKSLGDINFYVPADAYGPIEIIHHSIIHSIVDSIIDAKKN